MRNHSGPRLSKDAVRDAKTENASKCSLLDAGGLCKCFERCFSVYWNLVGDVKVRNQLEGDQQIGLSNWLDITCQIVMADRLDDSLPDSWVLARDHSAPVLLAGLRRALRRDRAADQDQLDL